jgi:hypothetical protein
MCDNNDFAPFEFPKITKWQQLLDEHGYEEKREVRPDGAKRIILMPVYTKLKVADNEDGKNFCYLRLGDYIYGEYGETKKQLATRLGWI